MARLIDHTGERFGLLEVICRGERPHGQFDTFRYWRCRCDCGNTHPGIRSDLLRRGETRSCGCLAHKPGRTRYRLAETIDGTAR